MGNAQDSRKKARKKAANAQRKTLLARETSTVSYGVSSNESKRRQVTRTVEDAFQTLDKISESFRRSGITQKELAEIVRQVRSEMGDSR